MFGTTMPLNVDLNNNVGDDDVTRRACVIQPNFESFPPYEPPPPMNDDALYYTNYENKQKNIPPSNSKEDCTSIPKPGKWRLNHAATLPDFYPLERTAVFIPHVADPSDITIRISEVLRNRSIDAVYHNEKAKAVCTTMEGVEFRIRLYGGRGEYKHGIIVEVQRRFGTSNSFHDHVMAILNAAEGNLSLTKGSNNEPTTIPLVNDESELSFDQTSSLEMISKMFNNPTPDTQFLAFQTLSSLTDVAKMGQKTAQKVAEELFRLENENVVGAKVLSLIIDKPVDDEDRFNLRTMALNIVANAFEAVNGKYGKILKEQLRQALICDLRNAEKNPRNAVYAARIITYFVPEDYGSDIINALEIARRVGMLRNALLESHATICLNKFD